MKQAEQLTAIKEYTIQKLGQTRLVMDGPY